MFHRSSTTHRPQSAAPPASSQNQNYQASQQQYGVNRASTAYGAGSGGGYGGGARQSYQAPPPQSGGFRPPPMGPPPGADPQLWHWFTTVDEDHSGQITAEELQRALVNGNWSPFDLDTVKMLMGIFDVDRSGSINFSEFAGLWKYIADWQNVFRHFDSDRSGSIDREELTNALKQFGYNLSPGLIGLICNKYAALPASAYGPPPSVAFDRFVRCCVAIKTLTESFQRLDTDHDGWVRMNYDTFLHMTLSAP